ncbi:T9SS type A sorting domain-containing protein [Chitinophagaceae bacterium MMS25-I14]
MKKILLFTCSAAISLSSFAQKAEMPMHSPAKQGISLHTSPLYHQAVVAGKSTGVSDTLSYPNNASVYLFDSSVASRVDAVSPADSGYIFGTNALGFKGFAEMYTVDFQPDTSLNVLGAIMLWHGTVTSNSAKTVNIKIWKQGAPAAAGTKVYYEGFPDSVKYTQALSIKKLGIGTGGTDTIKTLWFTNQLTGVKYNFYLGYDMNYTFSQLAGDTIALRTTMPGYGLGVGDAYLNSNNDTILGARNAIQDATGQWNDMYWDFGFARNYSIIPIIQFSGNNVSVQGVTKNNLTFFGNYPNPVVNSTTIKFALKNASDITVTVMDLNGRVIRTVNESKMGAGEHTISLNTADFAAGTYMYLVRTGEGDAMASKMTVIK